MQNLNRMAHYFSRLMVFDSVCLGVRARRLIGQKSANLGQKSRYEGCFSLSAVARGGVSVWPAQTSCGRRHESQEEMWYVPSGRHVSVSVRVCEDRVAAWLQCRPGAELASRHLHAGPWRMWLSTTLVPPVPGGAESV